MAHKHQNLTHVKYECHVCHKSKIVKGKYLKDYPFAPSHFICVECGNTVTCSTIRPGTEEYTP